MTSIKIPGPERKAVCKQVCRGGRRGEERKGPFKQPGLGAQTLPSRSPRGETQGWAWAEKELHLIRGTVVWVMCLKFKIEREMFTPLGFLSLYV